MSGDDRTLLIATHQGHGPSAEALWARFSPRMIAYARAILRDTDAALDIVQSVYLRILKLPGRTIREVQDVPAWLLLLTRNAAINHIRATRRMAARHSRVRPLTHRSADIGEASDVQECIERLPRRDREIIMLKHVAGLTFDQIAIALSLNRNTAAGRYRSAIGRLRNQLGIKPEPHPAQVHGARAQ